MDSWTLKSCFPSISTRRERGEADSGRSFSPCWACASAVTEPCWSRTPKASSPPRASEGHDLVRLAPRAEVDLHAGWKLSRIIKELRPDIVHAHDPHAVALASLGIVVPDLGKVSRADRVAPRRIPSQGQRVFALEVSAGGLFRGGVGCHPADARRRRDRSGRIATVLRRHRSPSDTVRSRPPTSMPSSGCPKHAPIVGAVAALTQEKGHRYLIDAAALVVREVPDARFVIFGEGELRPTLERQIKDLHLEKHVLPPRLPRRHPVVHSKLRPVRHELARRRARHVAARRDGSVEGDCRERHRWHSRSGRPRRDGPSGPAARYRAWPVRLSNS